MSRTTAQLALAQTIAIITGYLCLAIVLKLCGYPTGPGVRWTTLAVVLREHGLWLLALPIFWIVLANVAEHGDRVRLSYRHACVVAICITSLITLLFIWAALRPYTRSFLQYAPKTAGLNAAVTSRLPASPKNTQAGWLLHHPAFL